MRTHNPNTRIKPGNVRSRGHWALLGLVLGAIAALSLNPETGWIARREITSVFPIARSIDNPIQRIEFEQWETVNGDVLAAARKVAGSAKNDIPLQIANAMFSGLVSKVESMHVLDSQDYHGFNTANEELLHRVREGILESVYRTYPSSPAAMAAYVAELASSVNLDKRPEEYWIYGIGDPGSSPQTGPASIKTQPGALDKLRDNVFPPTNRGTEDSGAVEEVCRNGMRLDPQNAFFPLMLAHVHYVEYHDAEAISDMEAAAKAPVYNDYSFDLDCGWQRLDKALYGTPDSTAETTRFWSSTHPSVAAFSNVRDVTVWKAIELEHRGNYADGVALRMIVAGIGAKMEKFVPRGVSTGMGRSFVTGSCIGAGGKYLPMTDAEKEKPYLHRARVGAVYLDFLNGHGFADEANWYKPILQAEARQASLENIYFNEHKDQYAVNSLMQPFLFWLMNYWIMAEATLLVFVGLAIGLIGYRRRFAPRKEVYWSRSQWGAALGGVLIAAFCLIGCLALYTEANAWPLAAVALSAVAIVQTLLRFTSGGDTPIALLLHSLCISVCLLIAACISAIPVHNMLGIYYQQGAPGGQSFIDNTMPFGLALLLLPAVILFGVIVAHRVRYKGIPSGLFYGTRAVILPTLSIVLILWSVNVIVTAGIEKDSRLSICENIGLKSDAELR